MTDCGKLRTLFLRYLTEDSETKDARRKGFNQAIFIPPDDKAFPGRQVFSNTELYMVIEKFDKAVRDVE